MKTDLSRRDFLKTGSALVIAFSLAPDAFGQAKPAPLPGSLDNNRMLDSWLRIDADGTVTLFTGKVELGQGIGTALTQIAADELDVDLKRIRIVHGDTALTPTKARPRAASRSSRAAPRCASPAPRRATSSSTPQPQGSASRRPLSA